jgi:hypothetical protein
MRSTLLHQLNWYSSIPNLLTEGDINSYKGTAVIPTPCCGVIETPCKQRTILGILSIADCEYERV